MWKKAMMRLTYALNNGRNLIVRLLAYRQTKKRNKEAGGLLIGHHLLGEDHLVVDQITEPTRWDKRFRSFFFRSNKHNRLVYKVWCDSDRTETLIGLWHTHPEPVPTPSGVDFVQLRQAWILKIGERLFFMETMWGIFSFS
jgi:integrative and conjugative element protein (TIGR02256 family)